MKTKIAPKLTRAKQCWQKIKGNLATRSMWEAGGIDKELLAEIEIEAVKTIMDHME